MAFAVRDMEDNLKLTETNFNRRLAAQRNVDSVKATYEAESGERSVELLNILLNAQRSLAQAESDYFRSVTNYAKSISQVHYRKGSLLEYNSVYLGRRSLAGEGLLRRPPPRTVARRPCTSTTGSLIRGFSAKDPTGSPPASPRAPKRSRRFAHARHADEPAVGQPPEVLPTPPGSTPSPRPATPREPVRPESTADQVPSGRGSNGYSIDLGSLSPKADEAAAASSHESAAGLSGLFGR